MIRGLRYATMFTASALIGAVIWALFWAAVPLGGARPHPLRETFGVARGHAALFAAYRPLTDRRKP